MRPEMKRFLEASSFVRMLPSLIEQLVAVNGAELPDRVRRLLCDAMNADIQGFLEAIAPAIEALYTDDDLLALVAFYETPIGRKLVENGPRLQEIAGIASQGWTAKIVERMGPEIERIMDEEEAQ